MIIFDLDGTLSDCEHRRHFVDPDKIPTGNNGNTLSKWIERQTVSWQPNWQAFYEACDKDTYIFPTADMFLQSLISDCDVNIWSGRCESVRKKTEKWLIKVLGSLTLEPELIKTVPLKMRPIGDNTPDDQLKERWLNERCADLLTSTIDGKLPTKHDIDFVFDSDPKSIAMWKRRGVFVFDCNQGVIS